MWNGRENLVLKKVHEERTWVSGVPVISNAACNVPRQQERQLLVLRNVKNSFEELDAQSCQIIYKTYTRKYLEYAVQAWCPYYETDIKTIEDVQRMATKNLLLV